MAKTRTTLLPLRPPAKAAAVLASNPPLAPVFPLAALLLFAAASPAALADQKAQPLGAQDAITLKQVTVTEKLRDKDTVRATTTTIGKGNQDLRDIPQSITVITEKLINDRNLDTLKDALRQTSGITFQAAEGGEEDIRLRGFSLAGTGDIFLDGIRDPAFYDRDTFNLDRLEVLRGSASLLFGRGSTGGAVNQVSKTPRAIDENEITTTIGSHQYRRIVGDFNILAGPDAGLRVVGMSTKADNNGSGSSIDKRGLALSYRMGIGTADEFLASYYYLDNRNGINYGIPYIRPRATDPQSANTIIKSLDPKNYYGLASDYSDGSANVGRLSHTHRFADGSELVTQARAAKFTRDQRASTIRFAGQVASAAAPLTNPAAVDLSNFGPGTALNRGTQNKIQDFNSINLQSDLSTKFEGLGFKHSVQAGVDFAREEKTVFLARTAAQGGVDITKPQTFAGTPNDGASVSEASRVLRGGNDFVAKAAGIYGQDLIQIAPAWKLLAGLRYDYLDGNYNVFALPANAPGPITTSNFRQKISEVSRRFGALYQPSPLDSYHVSYGTSFNTSGDTYSYNALSANTPPESSENVELGAKLDSADKRYTTRLALFYSVKKNERNTDPDTAATRLLLSGKRHTAGFEIDVAGKPLAHLEIFASYTWLPIAKVDNAASTVNTVGNQVGDRPGLSPKHSGTVFATYQLTPQWRVGGGLNIRSSQAPADVTAPVFSVPGFVTADLLAEYTINEQFTLKGNISNLSNKVYGESLYRGHYVPGAGRLLQVSLSAKF